mmetsp:Transcript_3726/g.12032  ORF Transcript_3726/g.12032 Transcript_3726/m.12032 type:complete len:215 (-) Transcript_3726:98-742(-)
MSGCSAALLSCASAAHSALGPDPLPALEAPTALQGLNHVGVWVQWLLDLDGIHQRLHHLLQLTLLRVRLGLVLALPRKELPGDASGRGGGPVLLARSDVASNFRALGLKLERDAGVTTLARGAGLGGLPGEGVILNITSSWPEHAHVPMFIRRVHQELGMRHWLVDGKLHLLGTPSQVLKPAALILHGVSAEGHIPALGAHLDGQKTALPDALR